MTDDEAQGKLDGMSTNGTEASEMISADSQTNVAGDGPTMPKSQGRLHRIARRTLRDSGYLLATFPFALASFIVIISGLCLGAGLAIIWVGLPVGIATLLAARGFARLERLRLHSIGVDIAEMPLRERSSGFWSRMLNPLREASLWREALHGIIAMPLSCVTWSLALTWWAMVLGGLTGWIWEPISQHYGGKGSGASSLMYLLAWPIPGWLFDVIVGVFAVVTLPAIIAGCRAMHVGLGKALLTHDRQSLERRVAELSAARDTLGKTEADGLRRLERDLHDGPQQTLIRVGMDLDAAQRRLADGDVAQAQEILAGTRQLNDSVIANLRALSRSIAPPILVERGLAAALAAAAATSPIPVSMQYRLAVEPDQTIATAAYFVACEALANAVKYSQASKIDLFVGLDDAGNLLVKVADDGCGGAIVTPAHGLAGLRDRVTAMDGHFEVTESSGTTVTAVLPMRPQVSLAK